MSGSDLGSDPGREQSGWSGEGVDAATVSEALRRLHAEHHGHAHGHAVVRTLNLVVAPCGGDVERKVADAVARLAGLAPARTLVLREHREPRLDAVATIDCEMPGEPGRVGFCHDRVVLSADRPRLAHSASMIAPLLVLGLPTVVWLPAIDSPPPDPRLLEGCEHLLVDTGGGGTDGLSRAAELAALVPVHDLAWGRLDYWRAATAAAFEPEPRRPLVERIEELELRFAGDGAEAALLLAGWVAARAGWEPGTLAGTNGDRRGEARRADGERVSITLDHDPGAGCGGIERVAFGAEGERIELGRGAASSRLRDLFAEALRPAGTFDRGYGAALRAATAMAGEPRSSA